MAIFPCTAEMGFSCGLVPITLSETRHLLAHLTSAAHHPLDHALAWSDLRRTRQTRARTSHHWKRWLRHNIMQI